MSTTLEPKFLCSADDALWHTFREGGIGASESAAACGVSEWESPLALYYRKRGEIPKTEENFAMRFGKFAEPFIEREFEAKTGLVILERQPGLFCHREIPHILASPDGIIDDAEIGFEGKTINGMRAAKILGEEYTDEAPLEWNIQCQQQMLVMGWRKVFLAALVGGQELRIYEIERNDKLIRGIERKVSDLWQRIVDGNPPEMTDHPTNLDLVKQLYGEVETGSLIDLSPDGNEAWDQYETHAQLSREAKKEADKWKARVLMELGENEGGKLEDGRMVRRKVIDRAGYTVEPSSYIDVRAVAAKKVPV